MTWKPSIHVGDVIIHHFRPKSWAATAAMTPGDMDGTPTKVDTSRTAAVETARTLVAPRGRIYIRHHDDAEWEEVRADGANVTHDGAERN